MMVLTMRFMFKLLTTTVFGIVGSISVMAVAHSDTIELACDTTILEHHYTRNITANDGCYVAFGNRNEQLQRHGWWYEVSKKSRAPKVTEYHNGLRIHERWRRGCLWRIDENGKVISMGKAERHPKKIF